MSEAGGPGDKAQQLKTQVTRKAREVRVQALARAPQLTGAVAQQAQRVVEDKPGAAAGVGLTVLGLLVFRRQRRRVKEKKAQQVRGRSRTRRARRWAQAVAVLGWLIRRRRRRREKDS